MRTRMMLGLVLVFSLQAAAGGQTWDGGSASTNNWNDGNNWSPNAVPANNGTATPNFAGSTRLAPVVNVNFDVNGVTFDNAAGAFTISSSGVRCWRCMAAESRINNPSVTQIVQRAIGARQQRKPGAESGR